MESLRGVGIGAEDGHDEGAALGQARPLRAWVRVGIVASLIALGVACDRGGDDDPGEGAQHRGALSDPAPSLDKPPPEVDLQVASAPIPDQPMHRSRTLAEDTTIDPGRSMGPVSHVTSLEDLQGIYGEKALSPTVLTLQDGTQRVGTRIHRAEGETVTVVWWDDSRRTLREARDLGPKWATPEGIHTGMTLEELEASIGPFQVFGFGWENGGEVKFTGTKVPHYHNKIHLRMVPTKRYPDLLNRLSGDTWYDSSDASLRAVKPIVRDIVVSLEAESGY